MTKRTIAQKKKKQTNMHDEMIKYKEKVGSKQAKNVVNSVSVNRRVNSAVCDYILHFRVGQVVNRIAIHALAELDMGRVHSMSRVGSGRVRKFSVFGGSGWVRSSVKNT